MKIRQAVGFGVSSINTRTTMPDEAVRMPVAFAPVGCGGIQKASVEIKVANGRSLHMTCKQQNVDVCF
ncbi:hypothetical protein [Shimia thalassica]|uniref:hypothetical protein n=1 Tax=Shimia thalassica TaxID=1715693 RepID=UPI00071DCDAA